MIKKGMNQEDLVSLLLKILKTLQMLKRMLQDLISMVIKFELIIR